MMRLPLFLFMLVGVAASAQLKVGEVLILTRPELKPHIDEKSFQTFFTQTLIPQLQKNNGTSYHLLKADRGDKKGSFLLVRNVNKISDRNRATVVKQIASDKEGLRDHIANPTAFSEYHLIGADKVGKLPTSGILGLHFIKVKKERSHEFENFVVSKLHPAVSQLFPDMQLLYYKSVNGDNTGSYLTVFTIDSPEARHKYWPEGKPETEVLKKTFKPLEILASELGTYLEPGSFLEPESGGAAAYWESKEWTDYVHSSHLE